MSERMASEASSRKRPLFQHVAADGATVAADMAAMMVETAIAVMDDHPHLAATHAAFQKARQQIGGTPGQMHPARLGSQDAVDDRLILFGKHLLPPLRRLPQIVADDPQLRHGDPHPFGFGIGAADRPARARVLEAMLAVPDAHPDIEFVVEDADAPAAPPPYGGVAPRAP